MKHFLILLVLVGFIGNVYASPEPMPEDAFRFSKYVLVGKILSVEIISEPKYSEGANVSGIVLYTVKVEENLKTPIDENLTFSDEKDIIKVPGYFVREIDPIDIETLPYEVNQKVLLYIQIDSFDEIPDFDYVIRSDTSKVIGDSLCEEGKKFVKGICMIEEPTPTCKSGPRPDGEGWVFIDCNWEQYADVPVNSCMKGKAPANNYAWNSQDCLWEWSPLRNENTTGPHVESNQTDEPICEIGDEFVDGVCLTPEPEQNYSNMEYDESLCGEGTTYQDGVCVVDQIENMNSDSSQKWGGDPAVKVDTTGDDAPFFGIFVYLDNFFSWIFGK